MTLSKNLLLTKLQVLASRAPLVFLYLSLLQRRSSNDLIELLSRLKTLKIPSSSQQMSKLHVAHKRSCYKQVTLVARRKM